MLRSRLISLAAWLVLGCNAMAQDALETPISPSDREYGNADPYLGGVSALGFIRNRDVYGANSEDIGEVVDLVVGPDEKVLSVIARIEGFLGLGETYVSVPLEVISGGFIAGQPAIRIPLTEDEVGNYSLFDDPNLGTGGLARTVEGIGPEPELGAGIWRITDRIGDLVRVVNPAGGYDGFGLIDDFIVQGDRVTAVIVAPDASVGRGGRRAFAIPQFGDGWNPHSGEFRLPITADQALAVDRIQIGR